MLHARTIGAAAFACSLVAAAQDAPAPVSPPPGYTLHVYANRLQTATLILDRNQENLPGMTPDKVSISLDGGPRFHPTTVRPEGNDPVHLGVLFDASGDDLSLQEAVAAALPKLAATRLNPADHVSLFAVDCKLIGSLNQVSPTPEIMSKGLGVLFQHDTLHNPKGRHCGSTLHLWDEIAIVASRMGETPGRRVLLIVSQGEDHGSNATPEQVALFLGRHNISVFCLQNSTLLTPGELNFTISRTLAGRTEANLLSFLSSSNGGLLFSAASRDAATNLERIIHLLRTRYIVEFPPPDQGDGGFHGLEVFAVKSHTVLPSGVGWTALDPATKADPNTIRNAESPAVVGTRRPSRPR